MRVLLVEDNDGDAELVVQALSGAVNADVELSRVERLRDASELLMAKRFDVVLLDLSLPDASGLEGLQRLRESAPTAPVVVLTGTRDAAIGMKAIQSGAQDYLQKEQVDGPELLRAIRYARERAQYSERARVLADVGVSIGSTRNPALMLASLYETVQKGFADWCAADGLVITGDAPPDLATSRPSLPPPPPAMLLASLPRATQPGDTSAKWLSELLARGLSSALVVPFRRQGRPDGAFVFGRGTSSHPFGPADLALGEEITRRAVEAVEYAELLEVAELERGRAETASRVRDEFLATLSHELRTPLTAILGWAQLLRGGQVAPAQQSNAFSAIERNARMQVTLIEEVLDVSRIITGKIRLKLGVVAVAEVIEAALESIRPTAVAKGVYLDVQLEAPDETVHADPDRLLQIYVQLEAPDETVHADPDRLLQIFWNLLSNGVKFTPRGGCVAVRLAREESSVVVAVSDTGIGMSADLLPHVFERFRQADSTTTRTHAGLGLGLSIAHHLAELQGGTIAAQSPGVGAGSTFVVRLPVGAFTPSKPPPGERLEAPAAMLLPLPQSLAGLTIMLVDDHPDTRLLLAAVLQGSGASVVPAASATEALAALRTHRPHVMISDIGMPGESGYDLIRTVRALDPSAGGDTPAIALTAYTTAFDRGRALAAGFNRHVGKPVEPAELVSAIATLHAVRASA